MRHWPKQDDIFVDREALMAFAWSAPMRDLAAKVRMSDVGLKKLLRSLGVVTPPQGYWNKLRAGKAVSPRPSAAPRGPGQPDRVRLDFRFQGILPAAEAMSPDGPFGNSLVPEDLEELRRMELQALGRVGAARDLSQPHQGLIDVLRRERNRLAKWQVSGSSWDKSVFDTPLASRQLRLLNALFLALAKRGHSGEVSDRDGELHAHAIVGDRYLTISMAPTGKYRTERIQGYMRPARDLPASTPLAITVNPGTDPKARESWADDDTGKLETKIALIAAGIIVAGEAHFRRSLREAVERLEKQREETRRAEIERLAEIERKRLAALRRSGELLREAEDIRALVTRIRGAVLAGETPASPQALESWEEWALRYADSIDPVKSGQVLSHLVIADG